MVLDYGFIVIFLCPDEDQLSYSQELRLFNHVEEKKEGPLTGNPMIEENDVHIIETIADNKQKLGVLYKAEYNGSVVAYRKINFSRQSKYIIEEISAEIESFKALSSEKVVPIIGIILDLPSVGIITPYFPSSLYEVLHTKKVQFTQKKTIELATDIANSLYEIHMQHRVHGHLTSHNIVLTSEDTALIADLGFHKVKKYAGIMFGYTIQSGWSSPDIFNDKRLIPNLFKETDDVYSFGMILWELLSKQPPFSGYSQKLLHNMIAIEGLRPKIPLNTHTTLSKLIISCWSPDASARPSISLVLSVLSSI